MQERSLKRGEMHEDLHILRLGYHDRANLLPLLYPVKAGWAQPISPWRVETVNMPPGALVGELLEGRVDAAFVPPVAVEKHNAALGTLGGWGLASEARTESAILRAPKRLDMMHEGKVVVLPEARGSTAEHLLRLLLEPYYGIEMEIDASGESIGGKEVAGLVYGDGGSSRDGLTKDGVIEDLGVAWFVFTGLPAVWEMLVVRRTLEESKPGASEALQGVIKESGRVGQEQQAAILDLAAERLKIGKAQVKELFARQSYTLGEREQKGLARFLDLATRARL